MANFKKRCQTLHSDMQITAVTMKTAKNLKKHCLAAPLYFKFLLITQHKVPLINTCGAKKGRETEKRTANVQISRTVGVVGPSTPFYTGQRRRIHAEGFLNFLLHSLEYLINGLQRPSVLEKERKRPLCRLQ